MQTAVVTGAGRGLGRLIARGLADRGFFVIATDIDQAVEDTAQEIGAARAKAMTQDVRDPDSHRQAAAEASARGPLAIWVNNAGVLRSAAAWGHTDEDVRLQIEVNTLGLIYGCRAAVDAMAARRSGHIINMASLSSMVAPPGLAVYSASKHAVLGFSIALQGDLQHAGMEIWVSAVCPDAIDTDMTRELRGERHSALLFSAGKLLEADDMAKLVLELVDRPRLVVVRPRVRGVLAQLFRPFPGAGLRVLGQLRRIGERKQRA
jgi:NAD(P)-dependent dehydrogenase (short-subunit alcohol dehydrogenase family)